MKIAAAIPFYNEEKTILKTLASFLYEPLSDKLSFVLIDNKSTDNSRKLIEEFASQHSSIKVVIDEEPQQGVVFARKKALDLSLKLKPDIIISTDADTIFNKEILNEVLDFSLNKKFNVFAGRGTIEAKTRLERLIFFPEFIKLTKLLWKKEFELFGPYFFGACFALKSSFYKKISPYFDIEESLIIKDGGGEDLLLARRAYYMGAKFIRSKSRVTTSPRRYQKDPLSWMIAKRSNFRDKKGESPKKLRVYVNKNKNNIVKKRLINTLDRWFRTAFDANIFYYSTGKKYERALRANESFCKFFNIPSFDLYADTRTPIQVYKHLVKKHQQGCAKLLLNFARQRIKFQ